MTLEEIVNCHAEDAAFLWHLRNIAVSRPDYNLRDLTVLDNRVDANSDGLRTAGDTGWGICKETLHRREPGVVFAAAVLAFDSGDNTRIRAVYETVVADPGCCPGLVSALGWLSWQQAEAYIGKLLTHESPLLRCVGIAACAAHRRDPGGALIDALRDVHPLVRARALQSVGELGRKDLLPFIQDNLTVEDDFCRYGAACSAALLGDVGSAAVLKAFVGSDFPWPVDALKIAMRRMASASALDWQKNLAGQPGAMRLAIIGVGVVGDPVLIPWLMEQMTLPELARVAGEAFTMITGVDIAYADLEENRPEGFESGPTENPEDEDVEMDQDEDLPWPEPELINDWWEKNKARFKTGTRYLLGLPIMEENLQQVLRTGRQRQRHAAALELAMMKPGQPLFEVRAPGFRQQKMLGL